MARSQRPLKNRGVKCGIYGSRTKSEIGGEIWGSYCCRRGDQSVGISFVTTGERLRFNGRMNVLIWYCTLWPRWEVDGTSEIHIVCSQPFPPVPSPKLGKWDKFDHFPVVEQLIHGWWRAEISWTTTRILPKLSYFTSLCHHVQAQVPSLIKFREFDLLPSNFDASRSRSM